MKTNKLLLLILVGLTLFGQVIVAQESQNMTLLGNFGGGEGVSKAVFAAGPLVYYGLGRKVQIATFSDPENPVKIGSVIVSDVVEGLVRTSINSTQYIVACGGSFMWIINVANPTAPFLVSTVEVAIGTTCEGIATSGVYAYIAAGLGGLKIYDITTPAAPTFVSEVTTLDYCESVIISQPYIYIAANDPNAVPTPWTGKSFIYDISTPQTPVYKSTIMGYGGYHQYMNVRSGYAYICDYNSGGGLQVINVSDVTNPINVMTIPLGHGTGGITFDGNYAYVAVADSGMYIFNVVNPALPVFTGKITTPGDPKAVYYGAITINGIPTGHIYVSNAGSAPGMSAINVSNPAVPVETSFLAAIAGSAFAPLYLEGKVYVAYGTAGLRIIDVSNPSNIALLGTAALEGESRAVVVSGNYAYVAAYDAGVHVVDVTNPTSPVLLSTINTSRARGIAINGNYVYVATRDSGLVVLDITTPANPTWLTNVSSLDIENVATTGNVLGISLWSAIWFYDITNPENPVLKGSTPTFTTGNEGFTVEGDFAYVPDGDSLKIFNISNLMTPILVSKIRTGGYGYISAVEGDYCYVASEGTGVRAINISNPYAPVEDGYYDGAPQSRGVTANGRYVYVAEKGDGLTIYSNDLISSVEDESELIPESITLHQNYPNPFNPTTNIKVELRERAFVSLEVFNSLGERVATLLNDELPAGSSNVSFDGSSLSSGVYLYRLSANGVTIVKKMMMIK